MSEFELTEHMVQSVADRIPDTKRVNNKNDIVRDVLVAALEEGWSHQNLQSAVRARRALAVHIPVDRHSSQ